MKSLSESAAAVPTAAVAVTGWHRHKGVDPQHQFQRIVHGNVSHIYLAYMKMHCLLQKQH